MGRIFNEVLAHNKSDFTSASAVFAMASCHIAGLFFLPMMPLVMGAFAEGLGANSIWLGTIASIQLGATAIGAFSFSKLSFRFSARYLVLCAIALEFLFNLATALSASLIEVAVLRGLSGITEGVLLAAAGAAAVLSRKTEKVFVFYNAGLAFIAVGFLFLGSKIIPLYGYAGGFALFCLIDFVALILIYRAMPDFNIGIEQKQNSLNVSMHLKKKAFLALTFFGAALAGAQTFIERLGVWHGATVTAVGSALALGWCVAIISPFVVLPMIRRKGGVGLLVVAYILLITAALTLTLAASLPVYLFAAALFTPIVMVIEPIQFGVLGRVDSTGRLAALGPAAISVGSAIGPLVASASVGLFGLVSIGVLASSFIIVSILLLYPLAHQAYRVKN